MNILNIELRVLSHFSALLYVRAELGISFSFLFFGRFMRLIFLIAVSYYFDHRKTLGQKERGFIAKKH
jgi:hypothetical protein